MDEKHDRHVWVKRWLDRHVWVKRWLADLCDHGHKPDECVHCRLEKYEKAMTGWVGYGWKDGEYVDCLQDYFNEAMRRDDESNKTD